MERRLAAILAADVVDYSRMMGAQEEATLKRLEEVRSIVGARVAAGNGRIFSLAGDGLLAEFASPVAAVRAGFEIQRDLDQHNREAAEPLELRIGLHLADVVIRGEDLLGDGVNIAARIEGAAAAGSVTVSQPIFDQVMLVRGCRSWRRTRRHRRLQIADRYVPAHQCLFRPPSRGSVKPATALR